MVLVMRRQQSHHTTIVLTTVTTITVIVLQRKDFPSNSFYVVVVVKTEDQACGGSLPFYPFIEGTFCALGLAGGGEGLGSSWEVEESAWLVDLLGYRFLALDSSRPDPTNSTQAPGRRLFAILPFYFQMNQSIKGTARKPCPCWSREQSRVSVGG